MKALVTGAAGQLGSDLSQLLSDRVALPREQLSITDGQAFGRALDDARPEVVFNCAAYNAVDRAESEPELALAVNARAPGALARECARRGIQLVHFSTNFVFDGAASEPYTEHDPPDPKSVYARSKLEGERAVLSELPSALVVRSAGLFGARGSRVKGGSFPERVLERARAREPLRIVDDQTLNPTFTRHLAEAALRYVSDGITGVVHSVADGCCSWWQLTAATLELAGLEARVERISTAELSAPAPRPRNGCLKSVRVEPLPHWRLGLREWYQLVGE